VWVLGVPVTPGSAGARLRIAAAAALLTTVAPVALANPAADLAARAAVATPDPGHGEILYLKHCAACHRPHAWGDGPREIPELAGQHERYLREQLARYAAGERPASPTHGAAMHDALQAPDLNRPQALADLSTYLARAPRDPEPEHSEGRALAAGKRTYTGACSGCHGADGAGSEVVPAIGGQHYSYVLVQLDAISAGRRPHPTYAGVRTALPAGEQPALADYIARLTYLTSLNPAHAP
jgi:cytochrome c553